MRVLIIALTMCLITFFPYSAESDSPVPSVQVRTIEGDRVDVDKYAQNDKVTIIAFWATWCSPCRRELDNLYTLLPEWEELYDVELVAISIDNARTTDQVESYIMGRGWDFDVLLDVNEDTKRAFNFNNIPYSIVIDKSGNIVYSHQGYSEGDEFILEDFLKKLVAG